MPEKLLAATPYCTDQLFVVIADCVGLNSSMKSKQKVVAAVLPPPPYTWLMTRLPPVGPGVLVIVAPIVAVIVAVEVEVEVEVEVAGTDVEVLVG